MSPAPTLASTRPRRNLRPSAKLSDPMNINKLVKDSGKVLSQAAAAKATPRFQNPLDAAKSSRSRKNAQLKTSEIQKKAAQVLCEEDIEKHVNAKRAAFAARQLEEESQIPSPENGFSEEEDPDDNDDYSRPPLRDADSGDEEDLFPNDSNNNNSDSDNNACSNVSALVIDNGINIFDVSETVVPKKRRRLSNASILSITSHTQTPKKARTCSDMSRNPGKKYKVAKKDFTPRTSRLADAGKKMARARAATDSAYPSDEIRDDFNIKTLSSAAAAGGSEMQQTFNRAAADPSMLQKLLIYIGYGRVAMLGALSSKAKANLEGQFGIPGNLTPQEICDCISFLLHKGNFKYGGIDLQAGTVDRSKPFESPIYSTSIRQQFFSNINGADSLVFKKLMALKMVPAEMYALVSTAYEHALLQWTEGHEQRGEFTDAVATRYYSHLKSFKILLEKSPTHTKFLQDDLFRRAMAQSSKSILLDKESTDLDDTDFAALESLALQRAAAEDAE